MISANKQLTTMKLSFFSHVFKRKKRILKHHEWCGCHGFGTLNYHPFKHNSYERLVNRPNVWQVWNKHVVKFRNFLLKDVVSATTLHELKVQQGKTTGKIVNNHRLLTIKAWCLEIHETKPEIVFLVTMHMPGPLPWYQFLYIVLQQ